MSEARASDKPVELLVNARHLTGPRTGIEVYMEQLLAALARSGQASVTALSWAPLGLEQPGLREQLPTRRPEFPPGALGSLRATLWKTWFDQWGVLRGVLPARGVLFHGMDGFLPYALRRRDRCVATVHDLGWQVHPELYPAKLRVMYGVLFPWVLRRADRIIAVSRYTADDLIRRAGVAASRVEVVHHGLDPAFADVDEEPQPAGGDERYFLAVGGVPLGRTPGGSSRPSHAGERRVVPGPRTSCESPGLRWMPRQVLEATSPPASPCSDTSRRPSCGACMPARRRFSIPPSTRGSGCRSSRRWRAGRRS